MSSVSKGGTMAAPGAPAAAAAAALASHRRAAGGAAALARARAGRLVLVLVPSSLMARVSCTLSAFARRVDAIVPDAAVQHKSLTL